MLNEATRDNLGFFEKKTNSRRVKGEMWVVGTYRPFKNVVATSRNCLDVVITFLLDQIVSDLDIRSESKPLKKRGYCFNC